MLEKLHAHLENVLTTIDQTKLHKNTAIAYHFNEILNNYKHLRVFPIEIIEDGISRTDRESVWKWDVSVAILFKRTKKRDNTGEHLSRRNCFVRMSRGRTGSSAQNNE